MSHSSVLLGYGPIFTGLSAGLLANLFRNGGSLFAKGTLVSCKVTPFAGIAAFQAVNWVREQVSVPIAIESVRQQMALGNAIYDRAQFGGGGCGVLKALWNNHYRSVLCLEVKYVMTVATALFAKAILKGVVNPMEASIDISGHAMWQVLFAQQQFSILRESEAHDRPWQQTAIKAMTAVLGLVDAIWMYNTASNCHSVADVGCGIAVALGAIFTVKALAVCLGKLGQGACRGIRASANMFGCRERTKAE